MAAARNVLLIIADDFGIDASFLYNTSPAASVAPTPHLDRLAREGQQLVQQRIGTNAVVGPGRFEQRDRLRERTPLPGANAVDKRLIRGGLRHVSPWRRSP